ncbi:hypothetical protein NM208_g5955 [Fusarium decemcellulare]|uniref:Uncharacterized protein n=1 Tax=Fusarium decemcellulare TaxID=57161 RepID=A0ACC1SFB7_9HYPO|nr:hypothetical protein NM208_g5955 [Fusarium decemcellulare]
MPPFNPPEPTEAYPIKGIELKPGEKPGIRQELRDFKKDTDAWNLYLLGLWQFQLVPQDKLLSYFQVAGKNPMSSILFLTWHRPYLALFESLLRDAMIHVAEQFTDKEGKEKYLTAAKAFRMPYWDWARADRPVFPNEAIESQEVEVKMPQSLRKEYNFKEGELVKIPNPLYSYSFQDGTVNDLKVDGLLRTTRYHKRGVPDKDETPKAKRDFLIEKLTPFTNGFVKNRQTEINLRERVVYLLQSYELFKHVSYNLFLGEGPGKGQDESFVKGRGFGSLEDVHNALHNLTGGTGDTFGHMNDPAKSAFDPIFWLHHTNIDRLFAIWQGLREDPGKEDAWVTTQDAGFGTWATDPINGKEGLLTPLLPFYRTKEKFWTSAEVHDTATFGYAYPETKSWNFANPSRYRDNIREQLRAIYPSASLANIVLASREGDEKPEATLKERAKKLRQIEKADAPNTALTVLSLANAANPGIAPDLEPILERLTIPPVQLPKELSVVDLVKNETYLEWLVNIKAVKHALGGQYLVHIFLGPVPQDESTVLYAISPYHVGTFSPFGQEEGTSCGKCQEDQAAGIEITGQIPLTIALAERYFAGQLSSLDEEDVKAYLQVNLHWEVIDKDGTRLRSRRDHLEGLLIGVVSNKVTLPQTNGFPNYSDYITVYPEITTKQDGIRGRGEGTGVTEDNKHFY